MKRAVSSWQSGSATEVVGIDKIKDLILNVEVTRLDLYERKKEERERE